jgi:acyl-CoA synthetase (AMP-forming)/AMP-acid ligase II
MTQVIERLNMRDVTIGYGMTETSPLTTQTAIDDPVDERVQTVGRVHPHAQAKIHLLLRIIGQLEIALSVAPEASRVELRRNCRPHGRSEGKVAARTCKAAVESPRERNRTRHAPGAFQGADILGVRSPPLAKLVSSPGPAPRSKTMTSCPRLART